MAFSGVSGSMEDDFFTKSQSYKSVRQNKNQDAAHAQKRITVPLKTNISEKRESKDEGSVVDKAYCASGDSPMFSLTIN